MKIKFKSINRNGIIVLKFTQPTFEIPFDKLTGRMLNATEAIDWIERYDVAYDLFDFIFMKNSDEKSE